MPQQEFKSKLTTILSADVAGYSRLMADNEEETVRTLKSYRKSGIKNDHKINRSHCATH